MVSEFDLPPDRVAELVRSGEAQLVDVRTDEEHAEARIEGDLHIPLHELQARAGEVDKDRPVVFYCRSGERSGMAGQAFAASGWDAHNLEGGVLAWQEAKLPLLK